jgi:sigma-B regulation protein RsbU (phosphoserine phosphatase)
MATVSRLPFEAADTRLLSPELAAGIRRLKGAERVGVDVKVLLEQFCSMLAVMTLPKSEFESEHVRRLACLEIRGGNERATYSVELPGLIAWVSCRPIAPSTRGGDLHYLSVCSQGFVSRIALADVAGHGELVSAVADTLRDLLRKHADEWDQSDVVRELNDSFLTKGASDADYATALLLSHYSGSGEVLFTNAGHLPPIWYRAESNQWTFLTDSTLYAKIPANLPIGLIAGTPYSQTAIQFGWDDLLILYTDGVTESTDGAGRVLDTKGFLKLVHGVPTASASDVGQMLLARLEAFRGASPAADDETLVVLRRRRTAEGFVWPH